MSMNKIIPANISGAMLSRTMVIGAPRPRPRSTAAGGRGPAWERPGARPTERLTQDVSLVRLLVPEVDIGHMLERGDALDDLRNALQGHQGEADRQQQLDRPTDKSAGVG